MYDLKKTQQDARTHMLKNSLMQVSPHLILWLTEQAERVRFLEVAVKTCSSRLAFNKNYKNVTQKQLAVARYVAEGFTNKEVAKALDVSPETVKSHLVSIYARTGLKRSTLGRIFEGAST